MDEDFAGGLDGDVDDIDFDLGDDIASVLDARVSTGYLPADTDVRAAVADGYELFRHLDDGRVADYIPALANASPDAFGVCVAGVHGRGLRHRRRRAGVHHPEHLQALRLRAGLRRARASRERGASSG